MVRWIAGLCVAMAGCASIPEQAMPECELRRDDVVALLGVELRPECGIDASAMDFGGWRVVGGDVTADGSSLCVYRSGGAPGLMAEVTTIDGVPVDASVSAPPRTTCSCVAEVAEVCLPTGECTRLD